MAKKRFEELNLSNAFLFAAALEDEETCRMILEVILGRELPDVRVHVEHSIMYSADLRSIRLDVFASDDVEVGYDLEMQNSDKSKLPKRSRFHQAEIDIAALKPGEEFDALKPTYIIFICTFDPFEDKLYRYTFEESCLERDFPLGDETCKIFLNTKGTNDGEVPLELVNFLHYVENTNDEYVKDKRDDSLEKLHGKIQALKRNRRWRESYMTLEQYLRSISEEMRDDIREEVRGEIREEMRGEIREEVRGEIREEMRGRVREEVQNEIRVQDQKRFMKLISAMMQAGEEHLLPRLGEDEAFLGEMCEKYHL